MARADARRGADRLLVTVQLSNAAHARRASGATFIAQLTEGGAEFSRLLPSADEAAPAPV